MATAGGVRAGKAFIVVEALDKTGMVLKRLAGKMRAFSKQITAVGQKLLRLGAVGILPFAASAKVFANFDDSMRKVEARSSGTVQEMEALRDQVKELGRTTSFTASQVGELQAKLAQKGFNRSAIKNMTGDVLNLAKAAGEGTDADGILAADLISGTLRAFKMEATEASRVADIFTAAVNNSNFTLDGLVTSLANAGPVASRFKVPLEDTVAVLSGMTNLNIDASSAGTAFRNILLKLSDTAGRSKFNAMLKEATGQTMKFTDASGNLRPLPQLLFEIGDAVKNLGTAEQGELLNTLFGLRAVVGAGALSEGKNSFLELQEILQNSDGTAQKTADTMESGLGGAFRKFKSAVEGVAIALGEAIAGPLTKFTEFIGPILNKVAEWISENGNLVGTIALVVAGVLAAGAALIALGGIVSVLSFAVSGLVIVFKVLAAVVATVVSPVGLFIAAIAGGIALLAFFSQTVRTQLLGAWGFIRDIMGKIAEAFTTAWEGIKDAMKAGDLELAGKIAWQGLKVIWLEATTSLMNIWTAFWSSIMQVVVRMRFALAAVFVNIWSAIKKVWIAGIGALKVVFFTVMAAITKPITAFIATSIGTVAELVRKIDGDEAAEDIWRLAQKVSNLQGGIALSAIKAKGQLKDDLAQAEADRQGTLQNLKEDRERELKRRADEADATMQGRLDRLNEERKALDDLRQQAAEAAKQAEAAVEEPPPPPDMPDMPDVNIAAPAVQAAIGAVGAIDALQKGSAAAVSKFIENQQRKPMERLVDVNEEQLNHLENIDANLQRDALIGDAEAIA